MTRPLFAIRNLGLAAACWAMVLAVGCAALDPSRINGWGKPDGPSVPPLHPGQGWAFLNWIGFVCIAGGIGILIASAFVPILPRKAAGTAIVCGVGCVLARHFLDKFETVILWTTLGTLAVGFACLVWPLLVAAYRGTLLLKARELLRSGHIQEAAAFRITATPGAAKSGSIRKAIFATVQAQANGGGT
jgi:hypothetical protein